MHDFAATSLGKSPYLCIYDHSKLQYTFITNNSAKVTIKRAKVITKQLLEEDIDVLLAPDIGHYAFNLLTTSHIKIFRYPTTITVRNALYDYYEHKLAELTVPTKINKSINIQCDFQ